MKEVQAENQNKLVNAKGRGQYWLLLFQNLYRQIVELGSDKQLYTLIEFECRCVPGRFFLLVLMRITFATLLNKNASPDFVGKGFVARTRFELVSPP